MNRRELPRGSTSVRRPTVGGDRRATLVYLLVLSILTLLVFLYYTLLILEGLPILVEGLPVVG